MPVIHVHLLSGRSPEQKKEFIQRVTEVAVQTLDVPAVAVTVVLAEVQPGNWGAAGRSMSDIRQAPHFPA